MLFRSVSGGNVSGDAHFSATGDFSILDLAGRPGDLVSLFDPIISSNGDVTFGNYYGVSLKVETTGRINGGNIAVTGPDMAISSGSPVVIRGFESGDFTNWSTTGDASIETARFGSGPTEGTFRALATTGDTLSVSDANLETFLGIAPGTLDGLGNGDATEGDRKSGV